MVKLTTDQKFAELSPCKFLHIYGVLCEYRTNWMEDTYFFGTCPTTCSWGTIGHLLIAMVCGLCEFLIHKTKVYSWMNTKIDFWYSNTKILTNIQTNWIFVAVPLIGGTFHDNTLFSDYYFVSLGLSDCWACPGNGLPNFPNFPSLISCLVRRAYKQIKLHVYYY